MRYVVEACKTHIVRLSRRDASELLAELRATLEAA